MATLVTSGKIVLEATHTATAASTDLAVSSGAQAVVQKVISLAFGSGTGIGKADQMFSDRRTVAASSSEDLDLAGGVTDFTGSAFTFAKVKLIMITADEGNTNNVLVGDSSSNPWSALFGADGVTTLKPGFGLCAWANPLTDSGWTVTNNSSDIVKVANSSSGSGVTYDIVIIGASA